MRLVFYEEGRFAAGGFVHLECCSAYFETHDIAEQIFHFSRELNESERAELRRACSTKPSDG